MKKNILAAFLAATLVFATSAVLADTATITADVLNVRQSPNSTVIGQLTYGENVTVIQYENGWYQVQYGDKVGYIYGNFVSITPSEAALEAYAAEEAAKAEQAAPAAQAAVSCGENIVAYAKNFLGVPYVYGGSSPAGFDCSGFTQYVYAQFGISLPRTSYEQMYAGYGVSTEELQPGDMLVFSGAGHVGIYVGEGMYIHAPHTGRTVSIDPLTRSILAVRRLV